MLRQLIFGAMAGALTLSCPAHAELEYTGIALAGAEGGSAIPGTHTYDYIFPSDEYIKEFVEVQGMNTIRIPFRWERLQTTPSGNFNTGDPADPLSNYWGLLKTAVDTVLSYNAYAVIGPHNYGRFDGNIVGESHITINDFGDLWRRLALEYKDEKKVLFSLMNEPRDQDTEILVTTLNHAISKIRETGATNTILVSGNRWTGAHSWNNSDILGRSNAEAMKDIVDPQDNLVFVAHQYFDSDYSGQTYNCVSGAEKLQPFTDWLKQYNKKGFLEEFGASDTDNCLSALEGTLNHINDNKEYVGFTYWASGDFWRIEQANPSDDFLFLIRPKHLKADGNQIADHGTAQLNILNNYLASTTPPTGDPICPPGTSDHDGNGWGWDSVNQRGCLIDSNSGGGGDPICPAGTSDHDGNGWGWDSVNQRGCLIDDSNSGGGGGDPICPAGTSDHDGNGWGWDSVNQRGCLISN